jgi:hypothetical protein
MKSHPRQVVEQGFEHIKECFDIPLDEEGGIRKFLEENGHLYPILEEAPDKIVSVFGTDAKISLELHRGPEEDWEELFIIIKSHYATDEAVRLEKKLAEEWFLLKLQSTKGKLNITEEPL